MKPHRPSNLSIILYIAGIAIHHTIVSVDNLPIYAYQVVMVLSNVFLLISLILSKHDKINDIPPKIELSAPSPIEIPPTIAPFATPITNNFDIPTVPVTITNPNYPDNII